jgi:hypothetical protein
LKWPRETPPSQPTHIYRRIRAHIAVRHLKRASDYFVQDVGPVGVRSDPVHAHCGATTHLVQKVIAVGAPTAL